MQVIFPLRSGGAATACSCASQGAVRWMQAVTCSPELALVDRQRLTAPRSTGHAEALDQPLDASQGI